MEPLDKFLANYKIIIKYKYLLCTLDSEIFNIACCYCCSAIYSQLDRGFLCILIQLKRWKFGRKLFHLPVVIKSTINCTLCTFLHVWIFYKCVKSTRNNDQSPMILLERETYDQPRNISRQEERSSYQRFTAASTKIHQFSHKTYTSTRAQFLRQDVSRILVHKRDSNHPV